MVIKHQRNQLTVGNKNPSKRPGRKKPNIRTKGSWFLTVIFISYKKVSKAAKVRLLANLFVARRFINRINNLLVKLLGKLLISFKPQSNIATGIRHITGS